LTTIYFGNPLWSWAAAALVAAGAVFGAALLKHVLRKRLEPGDDDRAGSARAAVLQVARSTSLLLVLAFAVSSAGLMLTLPDKVDRVLRTIAVASLSVQAALWIHAVIVRLTRQGEARAVGRDPGSVTMIRTLGSWERPPSGRSWCSSRSPTPGSTSPPSWPGWASGGIAVALALQNILADVFASVSIILDKPYLVGDFIVVGDSMGTVERIGIKTTRVRSLGGEELVFANGDLLRSRIRNFRRMSERRIEFYHRRPVRHAPPQGRADPPLLREIIGGNDLVRLDRAHFKEFGEFSLTFECVYFVKESDYELFLGIQESINLEILRRFQEEEIALAHPSRMFYRRPGRGPREVVTVRFSVESLVVPVKDAYDEDDCPRAKTPR
jgi:hypothetical protein